MYSIYLNWTWDFHRRSNWIKHELFIAICVKRVRNSRSKIMTDCTSLAEQLSYFLFDILPSTSISSFGGWNPLWNSSHTAYCINRCCYDSLTSSINLVLNFGFPTLDAVFADRPKFIESKKTFCDQANGSVETQQWFSSTESNILHLFWLTKHLIRLQNKLSNSN